MAVVLAPRSWISSNNNKDEKELSVYKYGEEEEDRSCPLKLAIDRCVCLLLEPIECSQSSHLFADTMSSNYGVCARPPSRCLPTECALYHRETLGEVREGVQLSRLAELLLR